MSSSPITISNTGNIFPLKQSLGKSIQSYHIDSKSTMQLLGFLFFLILFDSCSAVLQAARIKISGSKNEDIFRVSSSLSHAIALILTFFVVFLECEASASAFEARC